LKFLLFVFILFGCRYVSGDRKETSEPQQNARVEELRAVRAAKLAELQTLVDADGYPGRTDCDLTLWVGEAKFAGVAVNLDLVEYKGGEVHRRPSPSCWVDGRDEGARSTVSGDMLAGYMLGRWSERNLGAFQRLAKAGESREVYLPIPGWVMGEPYPEMASRVVLRPSGISLVGRAIYALSGGQDDRSYRKWQPLYGAGEDYERHVQAVGILTDGLVAEALRKDSLDAVPTDRAPTGGTDLSLLDVTLNELDALKHFVATEPQNYFFHAVYGRYTGDMGPAVDLLLDPGTPVPPYVRGAHQRAYELIHWLAAAQVVLERFQ
jgi:hypothetical protein